MPEQGPRGQQGNQGNQGDAGLTGGMGAQGAQGNTGKPGAAGAAGAAGVDSDTAAVARLVRHSQARLNDRRVSVVFLLMILLFLVLAYRSETNARSIRANQKIERLQLWNTQQETYNTCLVRSNGQKHNNATWDALAAIERHNTFIDDEIRRERLAVYDQAKNAPVNCDLLVHGQPRP